MAINSFADWLNDVMAERDIRPADLARLANINKGILSRILSNERRNPRRYRALLALRASTIGGHLPLLSIVILQLL